MMLLKIFTLFIFVSFVASQSITITKDNIFVNIFPSNGAYQINLFGSGGTKLVLNGQIGANLDASTAVVCPDKQNCLDFKDVRLEVISSITSGVTLLWSTNNLTTVLLDCFSLNSTDTNWYGGPERWTQVWPLEKLTLDNYANYPQEQDYGAITEPYWLNSKGAFIYVDKRTPLFIDQNSLISDWVCFSGKQARPFLGRSRILLNYTIATLDDPRLSHLHAVNTFLGKPSGHPNPWIIKNPIWSTWARYKKAIDDQVLREFSQEIASYGFTGQFEIDDDWETCYGSRVFTPSRFSNITTTVSMIKALGFTVSLWVHPFLDIGCEQEVGIPTEWLVANYVGSTITSWWNSALTHHLDFTKSEVRDWYQGTLRALQASPGVDSFKFDAGEASWPPQVPVLQGDIELAPSSITDAYVKMCSEMGDLIEIRTGYNTQYLPSFVRMIDKNSVWGGDDGLYTLMLTLMTMNMNGYTMVLPDMVGGDGYGNSPSPELFVRWLQTNTFMPSIQFSFVPWDFANNTQQIDVLTISRKFVDLHAAIASEIIAAMNNSINLGYPVNGPVWFVDSTSKDALKLDTQFLLGEDIVVAPVIIEGAVARDIYIPTGSWIDGNTGTTYIGGSWIFNYNAPIDVLPYFVRAGSRASKLLKL